MKKCSANCIPCCDFCVHCLHAYAADGGGRCEPLGCMLHRDYEHQSIVEACGECDDFQCFRVPPTNADYIRSMSDEELAKFIKHLDSGLDEICDIQDISQDGNGCDRHENCYACYLDWLKQPAKEEHHEVD